MAAPTFHYKLDEMVMKSHKYRLRELIKHQFIDNAAYKASEWTIRKTFENNDEVCVVQYTKEIN